MNLEFIIFIDVNLINNVDDNTLFMRFNGAVYLNTLFYLRVFNVLHFRAESFSRHKPETASNEGVPGALRKKPQNCTTGSFAV